MRGCWAASGGYVPAVMKVIGVLVETVGDGGWPETIENPHKNKRMPTEHIGGLIVR